MRHLPYLQAGVQTCNSFLTLACNLGVDGHIPPKCPPKPSWIKLALEMLFAEGTPSIYDLQVGMISGSDDAGSRRAIWKRSIQASTSRRVRT